MSTSALDPVALVACLAALLFMLRARPGHAQLQPAMRLPHLVREGAHAGAVPAAFIWCAVATDHDAFRPAGAPRSTGRVRTLAHEAFGLRAPAAAEYGSAARIRPLRRVRSAILLAALLVLNGVLVALSIGLTAFLAGFLLEQAIK